MNSVTYESWKILLQELNQSSVITSKVTYPIFLAVHSKVDILYLSIVQKVQVPVDMRLLRCVKRNKDLPVDLYQFPFIIQFQFNPES